jgi:hypothetical protein
LNVGPSYCGDVGGVYAEVLGSDEAGSAATTFAVICGTASKSTQLLTCGRDLAVVEEVFEFGTGGQAAKTPLAAKIALMKTATGRRGVIALSTVFSLLCYFNTRYSAKGKQNRLVISDGFALIGFGDIGCSVYALSAELSGAVSDYRCALSMRITNAKNW